MHTVHLRVNDGATGKPTPVRVRLVDAREVYHAPLGRLAEFATGSGEDVGGHLRLGGERFAYVDGACEVRLPAGAVTAEVSKGPEYTPLRRFNSSGLKRQRRSSLRSRWRNSSTSRCRQSVWSFRHPSRSLK